MTNRERTRTKYAVAVVAAALVASLALIATVGLTRSEANRREPQGAPQNRPIAGIVGGGDAPSTEFPWMVTLYDGDHPDDSWDGHFCGGSLIAPNAVLTAAHCVGPDARPKAVVGAYNFSRADAGGASYTPERHTVTDVFIHPQYDGNFYDVAVLRLETPSALPPLRIAEASPAIGTDVTVIGWGEKIFYPADDDDYEWDDDDNDWWEGWDDDWAGWRDDDVGQTTYRPTYQPTSGSGTCDYTATPLAYDSSDCPANADGSIFPNCDEVACGELCEGDGECGTDTQLNNCPSKNYDPSTSGGRLDIYRKVCDRSTKQRHRPPKSKKRRPRPGKVAPPGGAADPGKITPGGSADACADDPDWRYAAGEKGEKDCEHVASDPEKVGKRCALRVSEDGVPAYAACQATCGCGAKSWGTGVGWCDSRLDKEIQATTPQECWANCHAVYGEQLVAVDFWDDGYGYGNSKACYCQDECQCMVQTEDNYDTVYVITVDSISELPDACDGDSYWYDDDDDDWWDDDWWDDDYSWSDDDQYDDQDWAPNVLQLVEVAVRDPEECAMAYLPGFDICAGDPPAEDACFGDSGGPLLVREGDAWAQVGVVSRGNGCAAVPGLYADATALREWILTTAGFEGQDRAAPQPSARRTAPPTPRPVALDSAPEPTTRPPTQEFSPTSRPTEPSATPDDPLGLPEDSATAAPTAESDAALGRRLAWAAAACALAALLL